MFDNLIRRDPRDSGQTIIPDLAHSWQISKDGKSYTRQGTGREVIWDFDGLVRRIHDIATGLPIPAAQFETMIATCRGLEREAKADKLVQLTLKQ